jgi:rhamnogalacturonyl hydrolase YesR
VAKFKEKIKSSIIKLEEWIEDHQYKGYEPFDGLSSFFKPLTFHNLFAERILQQTIRQCPINIRPLFGIKPLDSTKGRGYITWGYVKLYQLTKKNDYKNKAIQCLDWLIKNKSPLYKNYAWGNHFDYSFRGGRIPKYEPTIVWTSLIGQVFLDAYEIFKDEKYLDVAKSICTWILSLSREVTDTGSCISYVAYTQSSIHNSNMLGAAMLARTAEFIGNDEYVNVAKDAMLYSCSRQLDDGAWYYGHAKKYHWVDNFHTGYNLDGLKRYIESTSDNSFDKYLIRGYKYFRKNFFEEDGCPKYYHNRVYPIDIQCASQAIDTLIYFSEDDESSIETAKKVAIWTIDNMQDKTGYFYYRILPKIKVKIPMIHWGQGTMYKALSNLLLKCDS